MPISPPIEQLFQAIAREVTRLGIKNAVFGVADPTTGEVKVTNTKNVERHPELRQRVAQVFALSEGDGAEPPISMGGGFGAKFGG